MKKDTQGWADVAWTWETLNNICVKCDENNKDQDIHLNKRQEIENSPTQKSCHHKND